jgi:hypothetical protein
MLRGLNRLLHANSELLPRHNRLLPNLFIIYQQLLLLTLQPLLGFGLLYYILVHIRLFCLWRHMSSSSLLISLNHFKPNFPLYFWASFISPSYGFNSVIFNLFVFSILLKCLHHIILSALTCLTTSYPPINFSSSSLFPILRPSSL